MFSKRCYVPVLLLAVLGPLNGCSSSVSWRGPDNDASSNPGAGNEPGAPEMPQAGSEAVPDFSLADVNANSPRYGETVSVRDYLGEISAWYFGSRSRPGRQN